LLFAIFAANTSTLRLALSASLRSAQVTLIHADPD